MPLETHALLSLLPQPRVGQATTLLVLPVQSTTMAMPVQWPPAHVCLPLKLWRIQNVLWKQELANTRQESQLLFGLIGAQGQMLTAPIVSFMMVKLQLMRHAPGIRMPTVQSVRSQLIKQLVVQQPEVTVYTQRQLRQ